MGKIQSINPFNNEVVFENNSLSDNEIDKALERSSGAFSFYRENFPVEKRAELLKTVAVVLRKNKESYAKIISLEMGKIFKDSVSEIEKCSGLFDFYSGNIAGFLQAENIKTEFKISKIVYNPLGVILAVMPWNFPFWQVMRAAAPIVGGGNCLVLKHASNVSECSKLLERIFIEAGFPVNIFTSLIAGSDKIAGVIADKRIAGVTFTGSTDVGRKIAEAAGKNIKKSVLELGGNDPYVVFEDADSDKAAEICAKSRLINAGQSCIAAKRFIVHRNIYDEFLGKFAKIIKSKKYGGQFDDSNDIGPLVSVKARDNINDIVSNFVKSGAQKISGELINNQSSAIFEPVILGMKEDIADETEVFGPVALVYKAKDDVDAVRIANNSKFGLGSAIFSKDKERALKIAENHMEAGSVFINDFVRSDARLPFGGIKESGFGRELSGIGVKEFQNIKTLVCS